MPPRQVDLHVVYSEDGDWCALYVNRIKELESSSIAPESALYAIPSGAIVNSMSVLTRPVERGGRFPHKLDDLLLPAPQAIEVAAPTTRAIEASCGSMREASCGAPACWNEPAGPGPNHRKIDYDNLSWSD